MKKALWCIVTLICLSMGCSSDGEEINTNDTPSNDKPSNVSLIAAKPEITLYYDIPGKMKFFYQPGMALEVAESNDCIEILSDEIVTSERGVAYLEMKAADDACEDWRTIKVCDANDDTKCTEFKVRTTVKDEEIDTNHNFMIDEYETNTDKDLFTEDSYVPGDCSSFCRDDADCDDFCDSSIGYRCSTRCTSDDQCVKIKDKDTWISMKCRADGRCSYPSFKAVFKTNKDGAMVTLGGKPLDENVIIDWGDGTVENISMATDNDLSHTYANKDTYNILLTGEYIGWTAGCTNDAELYDVYQFGPVGLGKGAFENCYNFKKISATDIPDATKLTDMSSMFAGYHNSDNKYIQFNDPSIKYWDTSNVKAMNETFLGAGTYKGWKGFNQDIGRWNTSKVRTMDGMFYMTFIFNQKIGCWNVSKLKDISEMFAFDYYFTQNLENWNLKKVTRHDGIFAKPEGKARNDGKAIDIGIKVYCTLMNKLHREDIGRNDQQCWNNTSYPAACKNNAWKDKYESCKDKLMAKFPGITEDDLACNDLRDFCN